jgi:hypothetical protein
MRALAHAQTYELKTRESRSSSAHHLRTAHDLTETIHSQRKAATVQPTIQAAIAQTLMSEERNKYLNKMLARALVQSGITFHQVENDYFRQWVDELNPTYDLPKADTLTALADDYCTELRVKMLEQLRAEADYLSITTDAATTITGDEIVAVTGHYLTASFEMKSVVLACSYVDESKTAVFLEGVLSDITASWGKDFVITCTTGAHVACCAC